MDTETIPSSSQLECGELTKDKCDNDDNCSWDETSKQCRDIVSSGAAFQPSPVKDLTVYDDTDDKETIDNGGIAESKTTEEVVDDEDIDLELGALIVLSSSNNKYNKQIYLIDYLDENKITLINSNTLEKISFMIENGAIQEDSIETIEIIYEPEEKGYARQHGFLPGKWINITFGGDLPVIINGSITDLEDDMIEIKTYPSNETIYINFDYKGIPSNLPITDIEVHDKKPDSVQKQISKTVEEIDDKVEPTEEETDDKETDKVEEKVELTTIPSTDDRISTDTDELFDDTKQVDEVELKEKLDEFIVEADEIQFGEDIGEITQMVEVEDKYKRYSLETQKTDLLDELLSKIPSKQRTDRVLKSIHTMIMRFVQLRKQFSEFDERGNVFKAKRKNVNYKPLVEKLHKLNKSLEWILPVAQNTKKLYPLPFSDDMDVEGAEILNIDTELDDEEEIVENYISNSIPNNENKYDYLISGTNPYMTPFTNPETDNYLIQDQVKTNITAVLNNLGDLKSSILHKNVAGEELVIQKYNLGIKRKQINKLKNTKTDIQIVPNDTITITGMVKLPYENMKYNKLSLPNTNILKRVNLNSKKTQKIVKNLYNKINLSEILFIDSKKQHVYDKKQFLNDTLQIFMDETLETDDKYKSFLELIIPKTQEIFDMLEDKLQNTSTFIEIVDILEPYLIYPDDIRFSMYKKIITFLDEVSIPRLNQMLVTNKKLYSLYRNKKYPYVKYPGSILFSMLTGSLYEEVLSLYLLKNKPQLYDATILKDIILSDYGRLYTTALSLIDIDLHTNVDIQKELKEQLNEKELTKDIQNENDKCREKIIAKKYIEMDEMLDDNDKEIFFDKKYDNTHYDIINEYKLQQDTMSPDEFESFLIKQLQTNIGLSFDKAIEDAQAMIRGKRLVRDGQYALLQVLDKEPEYYVRKDNVWSKDVSIPSNANPNDICLMEKECLPVKKDCFGLNVEKTSMQEKLLKEIMDNFSSSLELKKDKLKMKLEKLYNENKRKISILLRINDFDNLKYDRQRIELGNSVMDSDIIKSPHLKLRDIILSTQDFTLKQERILKFFKTYCRVAKDEEEDTWYYCVDTDTKLLPTFYVDLANAFIIGIDTYLSTLDKISNTRGKISDNGDSIVDKYSGFIIRQLMMVQDSEYTDDGFKVISNEVLVDDSVELTTKYSENEKYIFNVIDAMSKFMGISIGSKEELIIKMTIQLTNKDIGTKEQYREKIKLFKEKHKGKKIRAQPYEYAKLQKTLLYSLSLFNVIINTMIPNIKTNKTFPGCIRSFEGYPVSSDSYDSLKYISCVANKIKSKDIKPWNTISKLNEDKLFDKLKTISTKNVASIPEIKKMIEDKKAYLKTHKDELFIPTEHNIINWYSFLPPLKEFKLSSFKNYGTDFYTQLNDYIKTGNVKQFNAIEHMKGKVFKYSMKILESIQRVVNEEKPLLVSNNGIAFLENACCDDKPSYSLDYFISKNSSIQTYIENITKIMRKYYGIYYLSNPPLLFDGTDTKMKYPPLVQEYSQTTIYKAFIKYCNYNSTMGEEFAGICGDNTSAISKNNTMQENIDILISEGKIYGVESLLELLNIVAQKNKIPINLNPIVKDKKEKVLSTIRKVEHKTPFLNKLEKISEKMNDFIESEEDEEYKSFKDYLINHNDKLSERITRFLRYSGISSRELTKYENYLMSLRKWSKQKETLDKTPKEEAIQHLKDFISRMIRLYVNVYPYIMKNKPEIQSYKDNMKNKKFSDMHENDLHKYISKNIIELEKTIGIDSDTFMDYMMEYSTKANYLCRLARNIPLMVSKHGRTPVFNYRLVKYIYEHLYLKTVELLIPEIEGDDLDDIELGIEEDLKTNISKYISFIFNTTIKKKKMININNDSINKEVFKIKDLEKGKIIKKLGEMTSERREIENITKNLKLGKWGLGLTKAFRIYDKAEFDRSMIELKEDITLGIRNEYYDEVHDYKDTEFNIEETAVTDRIDEEVNDLSMLGDDDEEQGEGGYYDS